MSMTFIRTSVCIRAATSQRLHVYIEIQRELRPDSIMDCIWICHKLVVREPHKTKRPAITSNNGSHEHIIPIHLINTDFFRHVKCHLVDAVKTADSTAHAWFHIQYSSIKQADTLPIYGRYGLAADKHFSDGVNYYRRLAIIMFQANIGITLLRKITKTHIGFLIFLTPFFFLNFPWKCNIARKMTWKTKCSTLEENRENTFLYFSVLIVSLVLLNNNFQWRHFGTGKNEGSKVQSMCWHHPLHNYKLYYTQAPVTQGVSSLCARCRKTNIRLIFWPDFLCNKAVTYERNKEEKKKKAY